MERLSTSKFTIFYYGMKTLILKENLNMELDKEWEKIRLSEKLFLLTHFRGTDFVGARGNFLGLN